MTHSLRKAQAATVATAPIHSLAPATMVQPQLRNLVHNMRMLNIVPWMQEVDLSTVIELWWYSQAQKASETEQKRTTRQP